MSFTVLGMKMWQEPHDDHVFSIQLKGPAGLPRSSFEDNHLKCDVVWEGMELTWGQAQGGQETGMPRCHPTYCEGS